MKTLRRTLSVLLCLALLLLLPLPASAAGPIDLGRPCSLTLTYLWDRAPIDWRIAEDTVPGYTASVSREDTTFILTNQAPSAQPPAKLPQTGLLWWPVPLLAAAGLLCLLLGRRRARRG